jgi:hypothetical protein
MRAALALNALELATAHHKPSAQLLDDRRIRRRIVLEAVSIVNVCASICS